MSSLELDIIKKKRMNKNAIELDASNNSEEYKVEAIWDSAIYARKSKSGHLSGFYHLVS